MANTIMANSPRQLSTDDAAFLLEVLHHLDAPIAVSWRYVEYLLLRHSDKDSGQDPPDRLVQECNF
jgi:hypothetical protein